MTFLQLHNTFSIFGLEIHIYGLILGFAGLVIYLGSRRFLHDKLSTFDYLVIAFTSICSARLFYAIHDISYFLSHPTELFQINDGGLALYGALIGFFVSLAWITRHHKLNFWSTTDKLVLFFPLAQAIGRLGNFLNYELYGYPTNLPWKIFIPQQFRPEQYMNYEYFHPTFLYEMLLNIVVFLILFTVNKRSKRQQITFLYMVLYGLVRICVNLFRIDKAYFGPFESSDLLSALFIAFGTYGLLMSGSKKIKTIIARTLSLIFNGYTNPVIPAVVYILTRGLRNTSAIELVATNILFFGPMILFYVMNKFKYVTNFDISNRKERPLFCSVLTIVYLTAFITSLSSQSVSLLIITLSITIATAIFAVISTKWKISGHLTNHVLMITVLVIIFPEVVNLQYLFLTVPFLIWSRVFLKHHDIYQTIGGSILGFVAPVISYLLISILT